MELVEFTANGTLQEDHLRTLHMYLTNAFECPISKDLEGSKINNPPNAGEGPKCTKI